MFQKNHSIALNSSEENLRFMMFEHLLTNIFLSYIIHIRVCVPEQKYGGKTIEHSS